MAKTREYMDYLDEHIGIAPANSQEELQAAELIADIMGDHGLEPVIEEFDSRPLAQAMPYVVGTLLFVLMIVQGATGGAVHVVTLILSLVLAALIIVRQFAFDLFEGFGPAAGSQNVVAVHHAEGDKVVKGARPIVVVAHLDTPRESLLHGPAARMHAPLKQLFAPCAIVAVVSLVIQLLVFLPEPVRTFAWVIGVVVLIPVLVLSVMSLVDRHLPCTEGANDNKSSVAALLAIMDRVCPSDDRVSSGESGARPRRRSADETELPVQSSTRIEIVEDVKGIRHGEEILATLGILPASCEIIYEEPKVRIIEEQIEVNPFADGFDEDEDTTAETPAVEAPAHDEETPVEDVDEGESEVSETTETDDARAEETDEDFEEEPEDADDGRLAGGVAAIGGWFSDRFSSLRERIAARRERALSGENEADEDEDAAGGRHARRADSEWFEDDEEPSEDVAKRDDEAGYEDEAYDDEGDAEDDYYDDEYEDDEDELAPLSADMVGSGRPSAPRQSVPALEWDDEEDEDDDSADDQAYVDEDDESYAEDDEAGEDDSYDDDEYDDDYDDDEYDDDDNYDDYEDEEDESDEYDESDDDYEDYEDDDYDDEPLDEEDNAGDDRTETSGVVADGDEWIDWEAEDSEPEPTDDRGAAYDDAEPQQGFSSRIKAFFHKHFSSQPRETANDEYYDDNEYDDYEYEDDGAADTVDEGERTYDGDESYDNRTYEGASYDEVDDGQAAQRGQDDNGAPAVTASEQDRGDWEAEPLAEDYDDYDDYEYDDADFDSQGSYGNASAEPLNDPLSDPNELHFDREEDDDILPRDTTGLDTISDSYDLIETAPAPQQVDSPTPIDDPNWGVSSFTPARPAVNIARRAALFDLPDPNYATPDPLRPEDDYEDDYDGDYEGDDEYYDDYEDDAQPYDYEDEVKDAPADDSARGDWKGGATMRSDLVSDEDAIVTDIDTLKDAILELGDDFLVAHDIWFVVTGASAADHSGIKAFLDEHRRDVRGAFLVNLDSIGAGALGMYVREGLRESRRADRRLVRMLKDVANDLHVELETASMTWDETDAATPMRSRLRAVTLVGLDDTDQPALSHTREDVPDNVNPKQVYDVVRIVCELIRRS